MSLIFRLYVGSLNFALTESDIRQVFQPFGVVELVDLHKDPITGKSKGFAFVQWVLSSFELEYEYWWDENRFKDPKDAMQALDKMNNFNLAGREVSWSLAMIRVGTDDLWIDQSWTRSWESCYYFFLCWSTRSSLSRWRRRWAHSLLKWWCDTDKLN